MMTADRLIVNLMTGRDQHGRGRVPGLWWLPCAHPCKTPGAVYTITIRGNKVACEVTLPRGVRSPRDARAFKLAIHSAMEDALGRFLWS
jgi:hypothetical protein